MARIESDPNYSSPTFSRATAATDLFKKEDVQALAAAMSTHVHDGTGKGLAIPFATAIPNGTITSAMIADATIDTADLKDGAVTSAKILDGTIATGDLANNAVTNAKLGTDTARANLLTNGGFEIWQRGNGPFTGTAVFSSDRWLSGLAGSDTLSVSRDTTNIDAGSTACAACTFTLGTGAGASAIFQQLNLNADGPNLRGKPISFSMRVRCATANAVRIAIYDVPSATITYSVFHTGGGTYETLTATATISASSTFVQPRIYFAASCTAYLDNAMLVVGSVPADYAPLHPADDLARCMRYYEYLCSPTASDFIVRGWVGAAGIGLNANATFRVQKPVTATVTVVGTWSVSNCSQPTVQNSSNIGARIGVVGTSAGSEGFALNSNSGTYITAEANP